MAKVNSVVKHPVWGHRWMRFVQDGAELIATNDDPDWESKGVAEIKKGHSIFEYVFGGVVALYKTKKRATSVVDLEEYLKHYEWNYSLMLDNTVDHSQWCLNVDLYFEMLLQDDAFKEKANVLQDDTEDVKPKSGRLEDEFSLEELLIGDPYEGSKYVLKGGKWVEEPCIIHSAKSWLKAQVPKTAGKSGLRKTAISKWLLNTAPSPNRKSGPPIGWIPKAVYNYLKKNRGWV